MNKSIEFDLSIIFIQLLYFSIPNLLFFYLFYDLPFFYFLHKILYFPTFIYSYLNSINKIQKFINFTNSSLIKSEHLDEVLTISPFYEILYFSIYLQLSYLLISLVSLFFPFFIVFFLNVLSTSLLISNYINSLEWGNFTSTQLFISNFEKYSGFSLFGAFFIEFISTFLFDQEFYYLIYLILLLQLLRFSYLHTYIRINPKINKIIRMFDLIINPLFNLIGQFILFLLSKRKLIKNK